VAPGEEAVTDHEAIDPGRQLIHDFRNLLAVIVNYSELIAEETDDPEAVKADIKEIRSAAERAIAMTDRLPRTGAAPPAATEVP
jgi:two-component system cell cycle sensor histidine kinase/response regulator CckA